MKRLIVAALAAAALVSAGCTGSEDPYYPPQPVVIVPVQDPRTAPRRRSRCSRAARVVHAPTRRTGDGGPIGSDLVDRAFQYGTAVAEHFARLGVSPGTGTPLRIYIVDGTFLAPDAIAYLYGIDVMEDDQPGVPASRAPWPSRSPTSSRRVST